MSTPESGPSADFTPASPSANVTPEPPSFDLPRSGDAAPPTTDPELRELALKRLKKRQDFRAHVVVYIVVNAFLWAL